MKYWLIAAAMLFANIAAAHEMTPAYPKFESMYLNGVLRTTMKIWNRREDASYYEVNVYDEEWNPVPFSTVDRIVKVGYLETKSFEIYIKEQDLEKIEFICTTSKLLKKEVNFTGITSKICSRVK